LYKGFRPNKDGSTRIRVIPGSYKNPADGGTDPCFVFREHRVWKGNKLISIPCSEASESGKPCVACYYLKRGDTTISAASERKVFTVLVLETFHKMEVPSKKDPDKKVPVLKQCKGRGCEMCEQRVPTQFGDRRWWSLGKNHFEDIVEANRKLGKNCSCEGGKIDRAGFECSNCGKELLLVENSRMTDAKLDIFSQTAQTCRFCHSEGLPKEMLECDKCQNPKRVDLFGSNIWVMTRGEKTSSRVIVDEWEFKASPREYTGAQDPWDFATLFAPLSPNVAARRLDVSNPFVSSNETATPSSTGSRSASVPYDDAPEVHSSQESTEERYD
jgi:hypothetical protein